MVSNEEKDKQILKSVLDKRRNSMELTREEQVWVDQTMGKLFEKKFKSRAFVCKTGDEIRKEAAARKNDIQKANGKPSSVQPEGAVSEERSAFGTKDSKIEDDDPSGTVKATEKGEYVNVDEKDGENAAAQVNASDIVNADNDDLERKPVLKFGLGDVVVKQLNGRSYVGLIVKYYPQHGIAQIKWANGTFSNTRVEDLQKIADSLAEEKAKLGAPKTDTGKEDVKTPGMDTDPEHVGLKPD
ncbi:MAG: hypothetical protein ACRD2L_25735, partial [Terriglobia bacterium]